MVWDEVRTGAEPPSPVDLGDQRPLCAQGISWGCSTPAVWVPHGGSAVLSPLGMWGDVLRSPSRLTPRCSTRAGSPSSSLIRCSW